MNPKVLLVDRNSVNARVLTVALEQRGFRVLGAASAPAALDALVHLKPNVVVIVSAPPNSTASRSARVSGRLRWHP